jgi:hypothetical protein
MKKGYFFCSVASAGLMGLCLACKPEFEDNYLVELEDLRRLQEDCYPNYSAEHCSWVEDLVCELENHPYIVNAQREKKDYSREEIVFGALSLGFLTLGLRRQRFK